MSSPSPRCTAMVAAKYLGLWGKISRCLSSTNDPTDFSELPHGEHNRDRGERATLEDGQQTERKRQRQEKGDVLIQLHFRDTHAHTPRERERERDRERVYVLSQSW